MSALITSACPAVGFRLYCAWPNTAPTSKRPGSAVAIWTPSALRDLAHANPSTLVAGTDLPSTRAPRPFQDADLDLIINTLGEHLTAGALRDNACTLYRVAS
jgi:hypothetical protein